MTSRESNLLKDDKAFPIFRTRYISKRRKWTYRHWQEIYIDFTYFENQHVLLESATDDQIERMIVGTRYVDDMLDALREASRRLSSHSLHLCGR